MRILVVTLLLVLTSGMVFAAPHVCGDGKSMVTISNPSGKVIEICVPTQVIDHIGGPGDVVIPAVCPCFSQEDVETAFLESPTLACEMWSGYSTGDPSLGCTYINCEDAGGEFFDVLSGPPTDLAGPCIYPGAPIKVKENNACFPDPLNPDSDMLASVDEAAACIAVLSPFAQPVE